MKKFIVICVVLIVVGYCLFTMLYNPPGSWDFWDWLWKSFSGR